MFFKRMMAVLLSMLCLCAATNATAFADCTYTIGGVAPLYEYADDPISELGIDGQTAYCTSKTRGDAVSITVEQTLEKYSGWFWIWNDVDGATWTKTNNSNVITMSNTITGLKSGKYRLKSVFTLTNSSGKTETITVYSDEKKVG